MQPALRIVGLFVAVLPIVLLIAGGHGSDMVPVAAASCDQIDPPVLLPEDNACPGWVRDGEPQTAYTLEELTAIINGGAFLYFSYGFVAAAFQNYVADLAGVPTVATLSVFNQGTEQNAADLYADPASGQGTPIPDWPGSGSARIQIGFGVVTLQFREACFFVSVVITPGDEATLPEARCLAEAVLTRITAATPTTPASWGGIKAVFD